MTQNTRQVRFKTEGQAASDGAGVQLTRIIGTPDFQDLDPFLMLDRFESNNPNDYIGGFPPHPHRGFETVTYLLDGKMRHEDNQGHQGVIEPGGVQWMTAGKGIIHSEMPEQIDGLLRGFQLWVNLPAAFKMAPPAYQEFSQESIPQEVRAGANIKVVAGTTHLGTKGPVINDYIKPLMLDISLTRDGHFQEPIPETDNCFIIVVSGSIEAGTDRSTTQVTPNQLAVLSEGNQVEFRALEDDTRLLLVSATPIHEPIARGGPFVMNSAKEIEQAFSDYKNGVF